MPNDFTMMNSKIIKNQINFVPDIFYQPLQKFDQRLGVHRIAIDHKTHFALVGDRGNQVDALFFSRQSNRRRLAARRITATMLTGVALISEGRATPIF